ncbi:hypothetical protein WN51_12685 [Melipona quadrifasciata]|uniref:Uncharacterized protein n=1 Tax=Melipona quadrifasciata TaxID=166423 RepID=A0A0N0U5H9_9HYME|nr:hypothetical protein WN51_12685 [Melipona quadrifasciata]
MEKINECKLLAGVYFKKPHTTSREDVRHLRRKMWTFKKYGPLLSDLLFVCFVRQAIMYKFTYFTVCETKKFDETAKNRKVVRQGFRGGINPQTCCQGQFRSISSKSKVQNSPMIAMKVEKSNLEEAKSRQWWSLGINTLTRVRGGTGMFEQE